MAVPKRRTSHSKTRKGRAHHAMRSPTIVYCSHCGAATLPHRVCSSCGFYQEREVVAKDEQ